MSNLKKRLEKIENQLPAEDNAPIFMSWPSNPWTEAEKAEMLRKHPDCDFFWKCMTDVMPYEEIVRREQNGTPLDAPWSPLFEGHASPEFRKRMRRFGIIP